MIDINSWMQKRLKDQGSDSSIQMINSASTIDIIKKSKKDEELSSFYVKAAKSFDYGNKKVDHNLHLSTAGNFQDYINAFNSSDSKPKPVNFAGHGTAHKMIHEYDNNHYMIKPYHNDSYDTTGWNTITVSGLYNEAGLGDMVEKVGAHNLSHDDVNLPVTVHKFSHGYETRPSNDRWGKLISLKDLSKIALMDYLVDNVDRHGDNIMSSKDVNDDGYHNILAIDHDHCFNYGRYMESDVNPSDRYAYRLFGKDLSEGQLTPDDIKNLSSWWKNSSPKLKMKIMHHLEAIKDGKLKDHIHKNFYQRAVALDEWADRASQDPASYNPFSGTVEDVENTLMHDESSYSLETMGRLSDIVEENPSRGFREALGDLESRDYNDGFGHELAVYLVPSIHSLKPKELLDLFREPATKSATKSFRATILTTLLDNTQAKDSLTEDRQADVKGKLNMLLRANEAAPSDQKFLNPIWSFAIKKAIGET